MRARGREVINRRNREGDSIAATGASRSSSLGFRWSKPCTRYLQNARSLNEAVLLASRLPSLLHLQRQLERATWLPRTRSAASFQPRTSDIAPTSLQGHGLYFSELGPRCCRGNKHFIALTTWAQPSKQHVQVLKNTWKYSSDLSSQFNVFLFSTPAPSWIGRSMQASPSMAGTIVLVRWSAKLSAWHRFDKIHLFRPRAPKQKYRYGAKLVACGLM